MTQSLNERFAEAHGAPIEVDGEAVHSSYRRPVRPGVEFEVWFIATASPRVQGVALRLKNGLLEVKDARSSVISLWGDTAPPVVRVKCVDAPRPGELIVSNRWRHADGVEDEWTNNAGMLIDERESSVLLRCSDGVGEPRFDDLVVELRFGEA